MKFDKLLLSAAVSAALAASPAFGQQDQEAQAQQDQPASQSTSPSSSTGSPNTDSSSGGSAASGTASSSGSADDVVAVPVPVPSPVFIPVPVEEGAAGGNPDELEGESVYASQDELLGVGEIQEVVRSKQDGRLYAVISSEEPLQVDEMAAVPLSHFRMQEDKILFVGNEQQFNRLFEEQSYQEDMYEPLDEARNEQAGIN